MESREPYYKYFFIFLKLSIHQHRLLQLVKKVRDAYSNIPSGYKFSVEQFDVFTRQTTEYFLNR